VQAYDWAGFLRSRLDTHAIGAPLGGITRGGWTLSYNDQPSASLKARGKTRKYLDLRYSLGLVVATSGDDHGRVMDVLWNSPAFTAGLAPGMKLIAINGRKFDDDLVDDQLKAAQGSSAPMEILAQNLDSYITAKLDYHAGPKYPHLTRTQGTSDLLTEVIAPKAASH
jgi:predicted metalloprotease with PDZ domain